MVLPDGEIRFTETQVRQILSAFIDWDRGRFTVHVSKTTHHEGGGVRQVPLFPELASLLQEAFDRAEPGSEYVIARHRDSNRYLRKQLEAILDKAGLAHWPRLFQNLRSSRETELTQQFPVHVVCSWLGNSPRVANRHYLQTTDDDFARAAAWALNPTLYPSVKGGKEGQETPISGAVRGGTVPYGSSTGRYRTRTDLASCASIDCNSNELRKWHTSGDQSIGAVSSAVGERSATQPTDPPDPCDPLTTAARQAGLSRVEFVKSLIDALSDDERREILARLAK